MRNKINLWVHECYLLSVWCAILILCVGGWSWKCFTCVTWTVNHMHHKWKALFVLAKCHLKGLELLLKLSTKDRSFALLLHNTGTSAKTQISYVLPLTWLIQRSLLGMDSLQMVCFQSSRWEPKTSGHFIWDPTPTSRHYDQTYIRS